MIARLVALGASLLLTLSAAPDGAAQTKVRVGWCAKTVSSAATPFAIATKMGWFKEDGVEVEAQAGNVYLIPPGHDAWVVGDQPCVALDLGPA